MAPPLDVPVVRLDPDLPLPSYARDGDAVETALASLEAESSPGAPPPPFAVSSERSLRAIPYLAASYAYEWFVGLVADRRNLPMEQAREKLTVFRETVVKQVLLNEAGTRIYRGRIERLENPG